MRHSVSQALRALRFQLYNDNNDNNIAPGDLCSLVRVQFWPHERVISHWVDCWHSQPKP